MALKAFYDDEAAIPAEHRALYVEKDGRFVLDVDGIETHPSVTALKNAHDRTKADVRDVKAKLTAADHPIEEPGFIGGVTVIDIGDVRVARGLRAARIQHARIVR